MDVFEVKRNFEGLPPLNALDIMRESARVLRRNSDRLSSLAAVLIAPLSVVVLTHILLTRHLVENVAGYLEAAVHAESLIKFLGPVNKFLYLKLADFLLISILYLPFAITLSMVAKAIVVYTVAYTYAGWKISYSSILRCVVFKVWKRLVVTYLSSCSLFIGSAIAAMLCLGLLRQAIPVVSLTAILALPSVGLVYCIMFVYMKIVFNLANVVVVVEDCYGFAALARSFWLVRGRKQTAALSFLVTSFCGGFLGYLFESRVTDANEYTDDSLSPAWEAPLLVFMHSFVYLFDAIMTTVFYFTCATSSRLADTWQP